MKKYISNTILSDFTRDAELGGSFEKIKDYKLKAYPESIAYLKMYTPYFGMLKIEDTPVNLEKIDEILEKVRGYYELVATKGR
ncbi:DUF6414 family protein [Methanomicrobium antiquum]|uniref:DUF6414 family protein n=1 Tax=Methanomicrobium antiquum TaxID=487686 RepID=A0AAF0FTI7_9EURY|nr:DUF6414 family protein [Methanomicrobium antiquum]WFN37906.1 DUF6414 family protein [Methanomicrobium antiquum]